MFRHSPVRGVLRLALFYAVSIPFIGFLISQNQTIGWIIFAFSFAIFSFAIVDHVSSYTRTPHEPRPESSSADEGLNPVATLTELARLASKPSNVYTSELLLGRIREAFLTKLRLILDLSTVEMRQMLSNKTVMRRIIHDSELAELVEGHLAELASTGPKRIESLLSKVENWTYESI